MSKSHAFIRPLAAELARRLREPRRFLQVVAGARQVGKTTAADQAVKRSGLPRRYATADEPTLRDRWWLARQWEAARPLAGSSPDGAALVLDEVQKVEGWSETVKRLWDEDTRAGLPLKVVLLGSAPLLVRRGTGDSLAGRFEVLHLPHWGYAEMREAFDCSLDEYLHYGGYPGAAPLVRRPARWASYLRESIMEPVVSRDVLLLTRVDKPALLRQLLALACVSSGRIVSYTKMLGRLQDAGNTTTLAHYLDLLEGAGMVAGLRKYTGSALRRRASSPKLQVLNTALLTAAARIPFPRARADRAHWGRVVESAVGAHLLAAAASGEIEVFYWREGNREVDFVARSGDSLAAIEVESGRAPRRLPGTEAFVRAFGPARPVLVGGDGIPLETFLETPVERWLDG